MYMDDGVYMPAMAGGEDEEVSEMTLPSGPSHHTFGLGSPLGLSQKISTVPFSGTANLWLGIKGAGSRDALLLSGSISRKVNHTRNVM